MTRNEAIDVLSRMVLMMPMGDLQREAINTAIDAVEYTEYISRQPSCNDCINQGDCKIKPAWGSCVRINCPEWESEVWKV